MKISSVTYTGSYYHIDQLPKPRLPEIAFSGRSNVGKSSLINCLVNRKKLALTSTTPGKTRSLNYYRVNEAYFFVDLPGYGYAKVPQQERKKWQQLIESFFKNNPFLKGVIHILDSRHELSKLDHEMIIWVSRLKLPILVVATKTDKLPRSSANQIIQNLNHELTEIGVLGIVPFSAITKQGKPEIWNAIAALLD